MSGWSTGGLHPVEVAVHRAIGRGCSRVSTIAQDAEVVAALAPLRNRDYRLLFAALAVSLTGDGIWVVAIAFQVIALGGGPVQLSLVVACFSVGLIGFILVGGIVADRLPRRLVMVTADLVRAAGHLRPAPAAGRVGVPSGA